MLNPWTVFLVYCSVMYYCHCGTTSVNIDERCPDNGIYGNKRSFAGDQERVQMRCPAETGLNINSVTWFLTRTNESTVEELVISADSSLSRGNTVRELDITGVGPSHEGTYSCRINQESNQNHSGCLFVIGKAGFTMCLPRSSCAASEPFELSVTERDIATFDSSLTFINGGIMNQRITRLTLYKLNRTTQPVVRTDIYSCDDMIEGCSENGRFQVEISLQQKSMPMLVTMSNLSMSDMGQYEVEITALDADQRFINNMGSIYFSLNVQEYQVTTVQESTTATPPTTTTTTQVEQTSESAAVTNENTPTQASESSTVTAEGTEPLDSTTKVKDLSGILGGILGSVILILLVIVVAVIVIAKKRTLSSSGKTLSIESPTHVAPTANKEVNLNPEESMVIFVAPKMLRLSSGDTSVVAVRNLELSPNESIVVEGGATPPTGEHPVEPSAQLNRPHLGHLQSETGSMLTDRDVHLPSVPTVRWTDHPEVIEYPAEYPQQLRTPPLIHLESPSDDTMSLNDTNVHLSDTGFIGRPEDV